MADVSVGVRAKRKRGRPRKDSNLGAALQSPESSSFMKLPQGAESSSMYPAPPADAAAAAKKGQDPDKSCGDEGVVGSMVYGVVEGSFDAGFLISVRIGSSHAPFRGVVFQPRTVVAVTSANDVAPQAKMYQRREIPVPVSCDSLSGFGPHSALQPPKQAVVRPHLHPVAPQYAQSSYVAASADVEGKLVSKQYQFGHPAGNLRMVEEDEVMQAFEVSTSSGGSKSNLPTSAEAEAQPHSSMAAAAPPSAFEIRQEEMICRETMDQLQEMNQNRSESQSAQLRPTNTLFQDVTFSENLFSTHQSREQESLAAPDLKLDLAFTAHKEKQMAADAAAQGCGGGIYSAMMKNPNIGYHQALVAGNPLLLPPDLMGGEPLEFMMEKPKSPPSSQEANLEVQSRLGGSGERFNGDDAMNKLELATPQASLSTRIADMDFVLSNAMQQPAQSHTNHG